MCPDNLVDVRNLRSDQRRRKPEHLTPERQQRRGNFHVAIGAQSSCLSLGKAFPIKMGDCSMSSVRRRVTTEAACNKDTIEFVVLAESKLKICKARVSKLPKMI